MKTVLNVLGRIITTVPNAYLRTPINTIIVETITMNGWLHFLGKGKAEPVQARDLMIISGI